MNFEPQKFFIGLMDFFSIMLPGALLTFFLRETWGPYMLREGFTPLQGAEGWAVFIFSSYLLGHLVFLLGALLDAIYDQLSEQTLDRQIRALASGKRLPPWWTRALVWLVFKGEHNIAVDQVRRLKALALEGVQSRSSFNTFQWAKAFLALEHEASLAPVHRFEADSKFFRCVVVVMVLIAILLVVGIHEGIQPPKHPALLFRLSVIVAFFAMWRYLEQRYKATKQVYTAALTVIAAKSKYSIPRVGRRHDGVTHAGGLVMRGAGADREFLVVAASDNPTDHVFPKGHIEPGEDARETAVREVHEETGWWARIPEDATPQRLEFSDGDKRVSVEMYPMEPLARDLIARGRRAAKWLPLASPGELKHSESRKLLVEMGNARRVVEGEAVTA